MSKLGALRKGHNCPPYDVGAVGILKEGDVTREVGDKVLELAAGYGIILRDVTPKYAGSETESLDIGINTANSLKTDFFISIHCNVSPAAIKGQGNGVEIWTGSKAGSELAYPIIKNLVGLGFTNRQIKDGSIFREISHTNMPAMIIELFFIDNTHDVNLYKELGSEKIARAILSGLSGQTVSKPSTPNDNKTAANIVIVKEVQTFLNKYNYKDKDGKKLDVDGLWGEKTAYAINEMIKEVS